MVFPRLEIVEFEGVGVLGFQEGITERDVGGVGDVLERVELSAPGTAHTLGVVDLQLVVIRQLIRQEHAGEELEDGFERLVVGYLGTTGYLLGVRVSAHLVVFAAHAHLVAEVLP